MKLEHKKYILENINKKSAKEIAGELGLKERKVKKFLEREGIRKRPEGKPLRIPAFKIVHPEEEVFKKRAYSRRSSLFIFLGIVLVAFLVRLIYLNQIKTNPFFVPFFHGLDDYLYDSWAMEIARGDILGKEIFYGLPLYPYFLGFIYFLFGHSVFTARVVQFLIGSFSCGLVFLIGQRVFNRAIGILSSLMLAFYAMAIYFEGFFVSAFLAIFLNCLMLLLLFSAYDRPARFKFLGAGLLIGLSSLASASSLLFMVFVILWLFGSPADAARKKAISYSAILLAGVILAIAPVTVRNYIVGKDFVPITQHSGITFYAGNNPLTRGSFNLPKDVGTSVVDTKKNMRIIAERSMQRDLKPSEISKFWFDQGLLFIRQNPARYAALTLRKAVLFWNANEIPDVLPMSFFKQYAPLLRLPLFNFSVICPLALFGMLLCAKMRRPDITLLYFFMGSIFLSTVIYFVNSRYRLLAVPCLIVFSAAAIYWFYIKIINRRFVDIIAPIIAIIVLFGVVNVRMLTFRPAQAYNSLGIILKRKGAYEDAIKAYKKSYQIDPDYDSPYFNLGLLYFEQGSYDDAIDNFKKALRINPYHIKAHNTIGSAYASAGKADEAVYHWRKSLELDPGQEDIKGLVNRYSR